VRKKWAETQKEHLCEERKEQRELSHSTTHSGRNVKGQ